MQLLSRRHKQRVKLSSTQGRLARLPPLPGAPHPLCLICTLLSSWGGWGPSEYWERSWCPTKDSANISEASHGRAWGVQRYYIPKSWKCGEGGA